MRLDTEVDGQKSTVTIRQEGQRVIAEVDGRGYQLEFRERAGEYMFTWEGRVFTGRVARGVESGREVEVSVGATRYSIVVSDPRRLRTAVAGGAQAGGAAQIVAAMPGKVVRVLVKVGDQVEAGSGILAVEAMKMQNEMKSPKMGTVAALNVKEGMTVNGGDVLAVIE
jgi:biotin carboxyl carrier protein